MIDITTFSLPVGLLDDEDDWVDSRTQEQNVLFNEMLVIVLIPNVLQEIIFLAILFVTQ
jgi:hypothetical protein